MEERNTIGLRVKKVREQLELKQTEFAESLSEDAKKISRIEKNAQLPDSGFLVQIGERMGVSLDWMLRGIGEMFLSQRTSNPSNYLPPEVEAEDYANIFNSICFSKT